MFTLIHSQNVALYPEMMTRIFRLRKKIFADLLNWDVPVHGDEERDHYDEAGASYLVWCSDDRQRLYGVVRLMTTDGPTLLHDVFWATHGRNADLIGDTIWEGTRMCLDEALIARDFPGIDPGRAFSLLLVALCEAALASGIDRLVSNFEPAMSRVYRRAGVRMRMHGSADGYGRRPVCCASFEVSQTVLAEMRDRVGVTLPLLRPEAHVIAQISAMQPATAC